MKGKSLQIKSTYKNMQFSPLLVSGVECHLHGEKPKTRLI